MEFMTKKSKILDIFVKILLKVRQSKKFTYSWVGSVWQSFTIIGSKLWILINGLLLGQCPITFFCISLLYYPYEYGFFQGSAQASIMQQFQQCESSGTSSSSGYASGSRYDNVRGSARGPFVSYLENNDTAHPAQVHYNRPLISERPIRPKDLALPRSPLI